MKCHFPPFFPIFFQPKIKYCVVVVEHDERTSCTMVRKVPRIEPEREMLRPPFATATKTTDAVSGWLVTTIRLARTRLVVTIKFARHSYCDYKSVLQVSATYGCFTHLGRPSNMLSVYTFSVSSLLSFLQCQIPSWHNGSPSSCTWWLFPQSQLWVIWQILIQNGSEIFGSPWRRGWCQPLVVLLELAIFLQWCNVGAGPLMIPDNFQRSKRPALLLIHS